jgi:hypothetical protein
MAGLVPAIAFVDPVPRPGEASAGVQVNEC